jgi:hypothetical protein
MAHLLCVERRAIAHGTLFVVGCLDVAKCDLVWKCAHVKRSDTFRDDRGMECEMCGMSRVTDRGSLLAVGFSLLAAGGWLLLGRRLGSFPANVQQRAASRAERGADSGKTLPAPDPHDVGSCEVMTELAGAKHDLAAMMRVVLDEVGHHVDRPARNTFEARVAAEE